MTSVLKVSKITGQDGGTNPPLSFDGDTATLDSSVSVKTGTVLKLDQVLFLHLHLNKLNSPQMLGQDLQVVIAQKFIQLVPLVS